MQLRKALYFLLIIASVSLACGLNLLGDVQVPFITTSTFTPRPTRTPTVTPTYPPKIETTNEQVQVEVQEDTTTVFTDNALGYRLVFQPEWLVVPVSEAEQNELLNAIGEDLTPEMQEMLAQTIRQAGIRMVALDYIRRYSPDESYTANFNLLYQQDLASIEYDIDILLEANVLTVPTLIPDSKVTYQAIETNPNGVEYGKMVVAHPASTFGVPLRQMAMMVKVGEGVLVITGSANEEMYATVESVFQEIFDSFEYTN